MLTNLYVTLMARLEAARSEEDGQGMVEYSLILALISIAAIALLPGLGAAVSGVFQDVTAALPI